MLRSLGHDRKNAVNEDIGYRFMESVTHAVHKHTARLAPMEGLVQPLGMERYLEGAAEPFGERLSVAVGAAGRDLGAAGDGVPGVRSPRDVRLTHSAATPLGCGGTLSRPAPRQGGAPRRTRGSGRTRAACGPTETPRRRSRRRVRLRGPAVGPCLRRGSLDDAPATCRRPWRVTAEDRGVWSQRRGCSDRDQPRCGRRGTTPTGRHGSNDPGRKRPVPSSRGSRGTPWRLSRRWRSCHSSLLQGSGQARPDLAGSPSRVCGHSGQEQSPSEPA